MHSIAGLTQSTLVSGNRVEIVQNGAFTGARRWIIGARAALTVFRERGIPPASGSDGAWRNPQFWRTGGLWERGWARRDEMWAFEGSAPSGASDQWALLDPLFPHYVNEFRFGEMLSRTGLDRKTQHLSAIGPFLAIRSEHGAEGAINGALNAGATSPTFRKAP